ncbi:putative short-chain dehydrogenase [Aspergillus cavernicola]|uniref:Short-chain dehydrogenase n=1 Tax=Aspergillus cavernicola TaxID=176166 RepID=A0ABR4HKJ4_9EURO
MSITKPVILILGSGPNIGQHVARAFAGKGYKVALTSRRPTENNSTDQVHIQSDLSDPDSVASVFASVKESLGIPSVVIYNAAAATSNEEKNPFSLLQADFTRDLNINTTSAFVAAQQAAIGFGKLPDSASKTFIYTGNILNTTIIPQLLSLGVGKSATAHVIQLAAAAYSDQGFKFYYADERKPDGTPAYSNIDGEAHGKFYLELAGSKSQGPWQQTFVKDVGYKSF